MKHTETDPRKQWIQTEDGKDFYPLCPEADKISDSTIATVLSRLPRFGGHCMKGVGYTVADHSLLVMRLIEKQQGCSELLLPSLLHDAHEVYTRFGDVCRPVKELAPVLNELERSIDEVIADHFRFDVELFYHRRIKEADLVMCATEKEFLMGPEPKPWNSMPEPLQYIPSFGQNPYYYFSTALKFLVGEHK